MYIFVGSENPVKINAVINAASETWPSVEVEGLNVPSGVAEQPKSDQETKQGALNRAYAALEDGLTQLKETNSGHQSQVLSDQPEVLGVGIEGGVTEINQEMWSTVWAAVVDRQDNTFITNGARFVIPPIVATRIREGRELGPIVSQLTNVENVKQKHGFIGIATDNFIDRTEEYTTIVKLALGLWYGREWERRINGST